MAELSDLDPDENFFNLIADSSSSYLTEDKLHGFFNFDKKDSFNAIHVNCRSLNKNFKALENLLTSISGKLTVIAVSETWLTELSEDTFNLMGYSFVSKSRTNKLGGGVGLYIDSNLEYKLRSDISLLNDSIECVFVEIQQKNSANIIVGCVYRPPNTDLSLFNLELLSILNKINGRNPKPTIIAGDFNIDLLKSEAHTPTGEFLNNLTSHSFMPTIFYPTRITDTTATLIDNIFFNSIMYQFKTAIVYSDISDHLPVAIHINLNLSKNSAILERKRRKYTPEKIEAFKRELFTIDWSPVYAETTNSGSGPATASKYAIFSQIFSNVFERFFPVETLKIPNSNSPRKCWITKGLIKSCHRKSFLYKKFRKKPSKRNENKYIAYRNKLNTLLRVTERDYYRNKLNSFAGDLCQTWKLLNEILNKNKTIFSTDKFIKDDGTIVTNPCDIVECFNDFFVNVGDRLASDIPAATTNIKSYLRGSFVDSFVLRPTNPDEVVKITKAFSSKRSFGVDLLPVSVMKECIDPIADVLSHIINLSFSNGQFPDELKIAKVCPVFKGGSKSSFSNYRPISVLPSFSKVFEKIMYNRLESYIHSKNILINNQYGFRHMHSTYMAMLDMVNKVSESIDNHEVSIGIFIDLSKAFDTLNHSILLRKLEHYGIRGTPLLWLNDYLTNRKQCVCFNNAVSLMRPITCGVPQGSILGPLLFILYVNDIVNCSKLLHFILFADDTNLFYSSSNYKDLMLTVNLELSKLSEWFRANRLSLNVAKTNYVLFGTRRKCLSDTHFSISINGNIIERATSTKFLGVYIDQDLNWKNHTAEIAKKISKSLGILNRVKYILPRSSLITLYRTMIHPYLIYCNIIWGGASLFALNRLVCLQKRALRLITCSYFRSPSNPLFIKLGILKLQDIHKYQSLMFLYKFKCNLLPICCTQYLQLCVNSGQYFLRREATFIRFKFRTLLRQKFISIAGPDMWDCLPDFVRQSVSIVMFKTRLLDFLSSSYSILV